MRSRARDTAGLMCPPETRAVEYTITRILVYLVIYTTFSSYTSILGDIYEEKGTDEEQGDGHRRVDVPPCILRCP